MISEIDEAKKKPTAPNYHSGVTGADDGRIKFTFKFIHGTGRQSREGACLWCWKTVKGRLICTPSLSSPNFVTKKPTWSSWKSGKWARLVCGDLLEWEGHLTGWLWIFLRFLFPLASLPTLNNIPVTYDYLWQLAAGCAGCTGRSPVEISTCFLRDVANGGRFAELVRNNEW